MKRRLTHSKLWYRNSNAPMRLASTALSLSILSCLPGLSVTAFAATGTDASYTDMPLEALMELDVFRSASLLPTSQAKAAGTVYSFNREDFVRLGARRLDDLLQFVPGIQVNQYRKRHRSVWSRGLIDRYNDKMVLLVDGVRMQHLYYGHFSLGDNFPLEKVEKVEIIQGPASSLYGANAFGGIISVTTRDFADKPQTETTVEAGDHQRRKATVQFNSSKFQAFASYLDQDAPFRDDRKSFIGGDTLQPLDETYKNISLKATPLKGLTLIADYQQNDMPFLFIPNTQDAFIEERLLNVSVHYEAGEVDSGRVEASLFYTRDDTREIENEQQTQTLGYVENQKSDIRGARITLFKRLFTDHVFALGATRQHEAARDMSYTRYYHYADGFLSPPRTGNLLSDPDTDNRDYSFYLQDIWEINSELTLTAGARYDNFEAFGGYANYRGALVYSPNQEQNWKLMYGTAIRTPSFREYLKVLEGTSFEAPTPDPERIHSLELGYNHLWPRANLGVTLFHNVIEDSIYEVPTPDSADEYFANSDEKWTMFGVESLLRYRLKNKLNMRLGLAYLNAETEKSGKLPYLATWSASLGLDYQLHSNHNTGFALFYNSNRSDTNDYADDEAGSFILANLFVSGRVSQTVNYRLGVDNLFNKKVYDPAGDFGGQYNTEKSEREIWLQLQWSPES
jgi:outer membrane cobalamin receptor